MEEGRLERDGLFLCVGTHDAQVRALCALMRVVRPLSSAP
jgi:hypothetical protein